MKKHLGMLTALALGAALLTGCGAGAEERAATSQATETTSIAAETAETAQTAEALSKDEETEVETATEATALPDKLTVTYVTSPLNLPSIVEKNHGIFEQAFAEMGIPVEYAEITSGADQTQALASGDVQFLYAVGGSSVVLSAANGADIKILNMYSRSPKAFCMYAADESVASAADLKGKTIAGPMGTNLHELLAAYLAAANMTMEDVNFVNMSIPDSKTALASGNVDVALLAGAAAYQAQQEGYHLVADGEGLIEAIIAVAVTDRFYQEYPTVIQAFQTAEETVMQFVKEQNDEAVAEAAQELDLEEQAVRDMYEFYDFSTETRESDIAGLQKTADFMLEAGMIDQAVDVSELFIAK